MTSQYRPSDLPQRYPICSKPPSHGAIRARKSEIGIRGRVLRDRLKNPTYVGPYQKLDTLRLVTLLTP